jgi:curli biogenesis system outer membrane secretion channel CsgG
MALHLTRSFIVLLTWSLFTPAAEALAQQQESFDGGIARIAESLAQPLVGRTVAVFEFPDLESRVNNLSRLVSEQLTTELVQRLMGRGRVLERRQVVQVLTELNLLRTDLTSAEVARVGRQLGADAIVLGSATTIGDQIVVNVRAVAVTGGEVLAASRMSVQGSQHLLALASAGMGAPSLTPSPRPASPTGTGGEGSASRPPSRFRGSFGAVAVELLQCAQSGSTVRCDFTLMNTGADAQFVLGVAGGTRMFDVAGNEYGADQGQITNQQSGYQVWVTLVSGVQVRASLSFHGVAETERIPLLEIQASGGKIQFRNIPLD